MLFDGTFRFRGVRLKRTIKAHLRVSVRFGAVQNPSKTFVACYLMRARTVVEVWNFGQDWGESLAGSKNFLDLVWVWNRGNLRRRRVRLPSARSLGFVLTARTLG